MELYGKVKNGVVVPESSGALHEGQRVRIEPVKRARAVTTGPKTKKPKETVTQRLARKFGGTVKMPRDWARNHDHYIRGTPKRYPS
jgi:hypothetical protein